MKGYKVFNPDWTCRDFQYEPGKTFEYDGEIKFCKSGFHFCEKLEDCFRHYALDIKNHVCEVETDGRVRTGIDKSVTNKLTIGRELSWEEVCERLSNDGEWGVRCTVALNPNTPVDIFERLSNDKDWSVRSAVAKNQNTPVDILITLSEDKNEYVRRAVAANLNTPTYILKKLSEDKNGWVRGFVDSLEKK